jgi:neutral trehalase
MKLSKLSQVHEHILKIMPLIKHEAKGKFKYPFLSVTYGQHYANSVFSWDNHHMSLRFAASGETEQMRYFVKNMLTFQGANGFVPCVINTVGGASGGASGFHAQPFLAQNVSVYTKLTGDKDFAMEVYDSLKLYLEYWLTQNSAPFDLFRWRETYMSGFDNEIAGTLFPPNSIISPDLNAWLYLELKSMEKLGRILNRDAEAENYKCKAENLKQAINTYLWDEKYGTYAAYDLCRGKTRISLSDNNLADEVGAYAFLSCPALIPLYAGIAEQAQAERMIESYVLNPSHFRSEFGIRSLSRSSEYYNNARWGNPPRFGDVNRLTNSNWQGPVWIPVNWFVFHGLLRYGFKTEAEKLVVDTMKVIARSIDKLGYMRENFHGETGEPLYADYFASWNILADLMPDYLEDKGIPLC